MRRTPSRKNPRGGFALLIVVLVVALIGVTGVALLDIVNVDLLIVGQHRRSVDATANAMGAMYEVVSDQRLDAFKPRPDTPGLSYQYAGKSGGIYVRDPAGRFLTQPMNSGNSAFVDNVGTGIEEGYEAEISLVRLVDQVENNSINKVRMLVHETRVVANINNGDATKEVRSLQSTLITVPNGLIAPYSHAR